MDRWPPQHLSLPYCFLLCAWWSGPRRMVSPINFPFSFAPSLRAKGKKKVEIGDVTCGRMLTWPPDRREEREETGGQKSTVVSQVTHQPQDDLESEEQLTVDLLLRVLLSTVNSCSTFLLLLLLQSEEEEKEREGNRKHTVDLTFLLLGSRRLFLLFPSSSARTTCPTDCFLLYFDVGLVVSGGTFRRLLSRLGHTLFLVPVFPLPVLKVCGQVDEASVRLGHKRLRTLMKRSSLRYLPGAWFMTDLFNPSSLSLCPSFLRVHPAFICLVFKRKEKERLTRQMMLWWTLEKRRNFGFKAMSGWISLHFSSLIRDLWKWRGIQTSLWSQSNNFFLLYPWSQRSAQKIKTVAWTRDPRIQERRLLRKCW